jgi:hypothetical protein
MVKVKFFQNDHQGQLTDTVNRFLSQCAENGHKVESIEWQSTPKANIHSTDAVISVMVKFKEFAYAVNRDTAVTADS